jgi:AmmeMemoRadiSam system protein B
MTRRPKVRKLIPVNAGPGEAHDYLLCDPLGLAPGDLPVTEAEFRLARLLDGRNTPGQAASAFAERFGEEVTEEALADFLARLNENRMLEGAEADRAYREAENAYRTAEVRPFRHAGESYPADPEDFLRAQRAHFESPDGPDPAGVPGEAPRVPGVFSPHIDITIAGPSYAHALGPAASDPTNTTYLILGTAHFRDRNLFILTEKDFATPFGTVEVDREFTGRLRSATSADLFRDELIHKVEHSIEFQVVYLHALLRDRRPFRIVPVLVSSFAEFLEQDVRPSTDDRVGGFLEALGRALDPVRGQTCIVAGVDLAHVGRKFGDEERPDETTLADLEAADRSTLARAGRLDAEGFWDDLAADGNRRRVCGLAPMYATLHLLKDCSGEVRSYGWDFQPEQGYVVTYAGVVFQPRRSPVK